METKNLAEQYDLPTVDWELITTGLDEKPLTQAPGTGGPNRHTCWLATIDPDGKPHVAGLAKVWADAGWPCTVDESGTALTAAFSAPSAGKPPWYVYRIAAKAATALVVTEPGGATRWHF